MEHVEPWQVSRFLPIIDGESLDGYVARVAAAHHFPRMAEITQLGGADVDDRAHASFCDAEGLAAIADCLRVGAERLRQHAPMSSPDGSKRTMFGVKLSKEHFQFTYRRFSPSALKASPHHRALWNLRVFPFCVETWEYLVDRCPHPACNRQQRWRRTVGIDLCDFCAEPLTRATAQSVPVKFREDLQMLVALVHPEEQRRKAVRRLLPPRLAEMEAGDLLSLACVLAPVIDHRAARPLTLWSLSLAKASEIIVPALAGTWSLLRDWPSSFEDLLSWRINQHAKARGDGNHGASYRFLSRFRDRDLPPTVRQLIDDFAQRLREAPKRGITGVEAAKLAGCPVSAIVTMRRNGDIPSALALDGQRLHVLFDKTAIGMLVEQFQPRIRLNRTAAMLGLPTYAVRELIDGGLLTAAPTPPGRSKNLAVCCSSLDALIEKLTAKMGEPTDEHTFSLAKLMLRDGGGPKPWAGVLNAILSGKLNAALISGERYLAERIVFADDRLRASPIINDRPRTDWTGISIPKADLGDMLCLSRSNFSRYSKYLVGSEAHLGEIDMTEAIKLAKSIISTTEIAARLQIHHTAAFRLATQRKVSVKSDGLFSRASAEYLIPELFEDNPAIEGKDPRTYRAVKESGGLIMHAVVDCDGRVRLPSHLRNRLGLQNGGTMEFEDVADGLLLRNADFPQKD